MKIRLFLAVAVMAIAPTATLAGTIDPVYQFTNTSGGPVSRADFVVIPSGSVQAPIIGTDPVTGLPKTASPVTLDASRSSGFDTSNFSTALGTGQNIQGLRLLFGQKQVIENGQVVFQPVFGPNGEAPRYLESGGVVTFSLHLDPAFTGVVTLQSLTAGIGNATLLPASNPGGGDGGGSTPPPPNIPEPAALALWSTVAIGLLGLRYSRPWQALRLRA